MTVGTLITAFPTKGNDSTFCSGYAHLTAEILGYQRLKNVREDF